MLQSSRYSSQYHVFSCRPYSTATPTNSNPHTALSIKNLLDQNIYSTVTIQQIADSFSYDKAHIIREFEKHYHQTPYQYLLSQKILIAKKLLLGTNVSITNISEQLGFKSVFYFSRLFKKKVGLSPREYRIQSIES